MRVQVAFQQAQALGGKGDLVCNVHTLRRHLVRAQDDLPFAGGQGMRAVAERGIGLAECERALVRAGGTHLRPVRRHQPQVDDVDLLPRGKAPVLRGRRAFVVALVGVRERDRFGIGRHAERHLQVAAFLCLFDENGDGQ